MSSQQIFARQHPAPGFFIRILASDSCTSSSLPMLRMTRAEPFVRQAAASTALPAPRACAVYAFTSSYTTGNGFSVNVPLLADCKRLFTDERIRQNLAGDHCFIPCNNAFYLLIAADRNLNVIHHFKACILSHSLDLADDLSYTKPSSSSSSVQVGVQNYGHVQLSASDT